MTQYNEKLFWKILFWVSMGFFALCLLLIYVFRVELGIFDKFLCGIAFAIGIFSLQGLQAQSSLEDVSSDLMVEFYTLQKQHEVIRDLLEGKAGEEDNNVK